MAKKYDTKTAERNQKVTQRFSELHKEGKSYDEIIKLLAHDFFKAERTIRNILSYQKYSTNA